MFNSVYLLSRSRNNFRLIFLPNLISRSHLSTTAAASDSATLSFLINTCGISSEAALLASRTVQLKSLRRPASVVQLFRDYGLTGPQIATIVAKQPSLLIYKADENLKPKLEFLHSFGFPGPDLGRLLANEPLLLKRSLAEHLAPCLSFYKSILHTNQKVVATFLSAPRALHANLKETILPTIQLFRQHGLPEERVSKLLVLHPSVLLHSLARAKELIEMVKQIGLQPSDPMFIHAYGAISGMKSPTWEKKMALYRSFGLSNDEILSAFRKLPHCMKISEMKISQSLEFYVEKMKLSLTSVAANPKLLMPSLEKTIKPRCAILSILMSKERIKRDLSLISTLMLSNRHFLQRYVEKYQDDVPEVLKVYQGEIEFKDLELH